MTKHLQLSSMLDQIQTEVPEVRAAVLASRDGLAMASTIDGAESSRIAAMAATVHGVGYRVAETAELGDLVETVIRSNDLTFVVYDAGTPAVLALLAQGDCNLGLVHLEGRRTATALSELLTVPAPPQEDSDTDDESDDAADIESADDADEPKATDASPDTSDEPDEAVTSDEIADLDDDYVSQFAPPPPPPGMAEHSSRPDETSPNGHDDSSGEQFGYHEHATP